MEKKINYSFEFSKQYKEICKNSREIPNILFHVCCGACSCYPLVFLANLFNITIYFTNSNIFPESEYNLRFNEVKRYKEIVEKQFNIKINLIKDDYSYDSFKEDLVPYKDQKEGQERCKICIAKRFDRLFQYAQTHGFKYVSSVMSISRNKDVNYLNGLGKSLESKYPGITYIYNDFKKNNGQDIGVDLSKKYNIYRQDYCGCEFSISNKK